MGTAHLCESTCRHIPQSQGFDASVRLCTGASQKVISPAFQLGLYMVRESCQGLGPAHQSDPQTISSRTGQLGQDNSPATLASGDIPWRTSSPWMILESQPCSRHMQGQQRQVRWSRYRQPTSVTAPPPFIFVLVATSYMSKKIVVVHS